MKIKYGPNGERVIICESERGLIISAPVCQMDQPETVAGRVFPFQWKIRKDKSWALEFFDSQLAGWREVPVIEQK